MPSIVRFGLAASDPDASASVYQAVFGRKITKWEGPQECWLVETGDEGEQGINGGLFAPNEILSGTLNTIDVSDIDAFIEKIEQHGGAYRCREACRSRHWLQCLRKGCRWVSVQYPPGGYKGEMSPDFIQEYPNLS
jgi:predicted enzyme related to lactoylglutathione lyase